MKWEEYQLTYGLFLVMVGMKFMTESEYVKATDELLHRK